MFKWLHKQKQRIAPNYIDHSINEIYGISFTNLTLDDDECYYITDTKQVLMDVLANMYKDKKHTFSNINYFVSQINRKKCNMNDLFSDTISYNELNLREQIYIIDYISKARELPSFITNAFTKNEYIEHKSIRKYSCLASDRQEVITTLQRLKGNSNYHNITVSISDIIKEKHDINELIIDN